MKRSASEPGLNGFLLVAIFSVFQPTPRPDIAGVYSNLIKRQHGKDDFNVTAATIVCCEHFRQNDNIRKLSGRWGKYIITAALC